MKLDQLRVVDFENGYTQAQLDNWLDTTTRPATFDDLKSLGEEIWWCVTHKAQGPCAKVENLEGFEVEVPEVDQGECWPAIWCEADMSKGFCKMVKAILIRDTSGAGE